MPMTVAEAEALLDEAFAPWVRDMDITVLAVGDGSAALRIPPSERLNRVGGTLCGQAMMALADTAMVFAVAGSAGGFVPMTTIGQTTAFLRAAGANPVTAEARLIRKGRQVVYGEVTLHDGDPARPIAHVTSTYMLLPG